MRTLKSLWTPTSCLYDRADEGQPRRFVLDCGIAWQNYRDDAGIFQEIDLTPEVIPGGLRVRKVPYNLTLLTTGERCIAPDRAFASKFIRFPANKFLANKSFTRVGNSLVWKSPKYDIVLRWENSRVKFDVVVKGSTPFDSVNFDVDKAGIDDATLLSYMANLKAIDSSTPEPIMRPLSVSLVGGVLTLGFDLTGMTFPVTIDPTLDLQVGASEDDCFVNVLNTSSPPHTWTDFALAAATNAVGEVGVFRDGCGQRFLNVTPANGDTIDVAYMTFTAKANNASTVVNSDIYGEDAANAAAYSTLADFNGRAKLAAVVWDGVGSWTLNQPYNTPSLVTPTQAIADKAGRVAGDAMAFKWEDGGSGNEAVRTAWTFDSDSTKAAKLHIEYTAGGATVSLAGGVSPSGVFLFTASTIYAGVNTPTGVVLKNVSTTFAGSGGSSGSLVKKPQTIFGGVMPSLGGILQNVGKGVGGGNTPTGVIVRRTQKALVGTCAQVGVLGHACSHTLGGVVTPVGAALKRITHSFAGALTSVGALVSSVGKLMGGAIASAGVVVRQAQKILGGVCAQAGAVGHACSQVLGGVLTPVGGLLGNITQIFAGGLVPIGTVLKQARLPLAGVIAPITGSLVWGVQQVLAGVVAASGGLLWALRKQFSGTIVPAGGLWRYAGYGAILRFHHDNYPTKTTYRFQVRMRATSNTMGARLVNMDTGVVVADSELTTTSTSWTTLTSAALALQDNSDYEIQFGSNGSGAFRSAKIRAT